VGVKSTLRARRSRRLRFFSFQVVQTFGAHSASYSVGTNVLSKGIKRLERGVNHSLASSAESNSQMIHLLLSLYICPWRGQGEFYHLFYLLRVLHLHCSLGIENSHNFSWSANRLRGTSAARHAEVSQSKLVSYLSLFTFHDSSWTNVDTLLFNNRTEGQKTQQCDGCNNRNVKKKSFRKNSTREFEPKMSIYSVALLCFLLPMQMA